ncbi:MAG: flavodoxin [Dictyoglomaceae bacterium]
MNQNILIVYYSWSGNTRKAAEIIHKYVGGKIIEIEPEKPYPKSYNDTVRQAKKEIEAKYKPPIKPKVEGINEFDIIFIGTPNWWSTIAPPVATFLSEHDFSGKTIIPFCTHGGGGKGRIVEDISKLCPDSKILECFSTYERGSKDLESKIIEWLKRIGLLK